MGRDKCFVVCEKPFLPDDFPSDIRGALNPNYMDVRDAELTAKMVTKEIVKKMRLKTHSRILSDQSYGYDYMKILDDLPPKIFEEKPDLQMSHILDSWLQNVYSFTYTEERICYILERIVFFPIFPKNSKMKHFLDQMKEAIRTEVKDFSEEETEELIASRMLVMRVLEYVQLRMDLNMKLSPRMLSYEFSRVSDDLEQYIEFNHERKIKANWYTMVVALDYAALARMQAIKATTDNKNNTIEELVQVIDYLNQVENIIQQNFRRAAELWSGYIQYNLSRVYEQIVLTIDESSIKSHEVTGKSREEWIEKVRESSLKAISVRHRWMDNGMKGVFSTALSYEYFLALKHEYELCENLRGYSEDKKEKVADSIRNTLAELTVYCKTSGLEKLYDIREAFVKMAMRMR